MEIISFGAGLRRRRGYSRLSPTNRRAMPVARLGAGKRSSWRLKLARKLRIMRAASPLKLWYRLKSGYVSMMLRLATNAGSSNSTNVFGSRRVPKAREASMGYSRSEFDNRLLFEIYKSMSASLELGYNKQSS